MKNFLSKKKIAILSLALAVVTSTSFAAKKEPVQNWTKSQTRDGYSLIRNPGGKDLGIADGSDVQILTVKGFAFKDLNRNGKLDKFEDWRLTPQKRAEDLANQLSIEEIAGLMLYSAHQRKLAPELNDEQIKMLRDDHVRTVLNADIGASVETTVRWNNALQAFAESLPFGIPANTSADPRNDARSAGAYQPTKANVSKWPNNLGLAATFDPEIVRQFGKIQAKEYRLMGIGTGLSPQMDLATDPRWTRNYGTFGEDPALSRDMARANVDGGQSTYENGEDIGWGALSLNQMMKHFPGDCVGEGGREAHSKYGKYGIYLGNGLSTQLIPFVDGAMNLDGKTGSASAAMMSYSIAWSEDGKYGDLVGSAYSKYKIDLLRSKYKFDGVICTDWCVTWNTDRNLSMAWGVENDNEAHRHYLALMAGVDQFGGNNAIQPVLEAYKMGVAEHGEKFMDKRFRQSATRLLRNIFQIGLFENPYLDVARSVREVGNPSDKDAGFQAQLKSIVMLKNENNAIHLPTNRKKPTVYVPMIFRPEQRVKAFNSYTKAEWFLPLEIEVAKKYFNIVTDTVGELTGVDKDGNPMATVNDIRRLSPDQMSEVDFMLPIIDNPINAGNQFDGLGFDQEKQEFIPLSLQYSPYIANSDAVRKQSIANDPGENRSYFGKSAKIINATDLDGVRHAYDCANLSGRKIPVVTLIHALKPMVFSEIEPLSDAILVGYGVSDAAYFEILAGRFEPQGLLPMQQPKNMEAVEKQLGDIPRDMECYTDSVGHVYDFGYGLNWSGVISDSRTAKYKVPVISGDSDSKKKK